MNLVPPSYRAKTNSQPDVISIAGDRQTRFVAFSAKADRPLPSRNDATTSAITVAHPCDLCATSSDKWAVKHCLRQEAGRRTLPPVTFSLSSATSSKQEQTTKTTADNKRNSRRQKLQQTIKKAEDDKNRSTYKEQTCVLGAIEKVVYGPIGLTAR